MRRLFLMGACAASAMVAATAIPVTVKRRLQMDAFMSGLLPTVAFDVRRARLAHGATVLALRNGPALLIDVLERAICMLAVADSVSAHTGFTSPLLTVDQHGERLVRG